MKTVLLVDDEPIAVDGLYAVLEEEQELELNIYRAYSPSEAIARAGEAKIDILLSDIRMPEMTGLKLAERVLERWPRCRCIFLTGYKDFEFVQSAIRTGGIDYVLKTEGDERILEALRRAIAEIEREWDDEQLLNKARDNLYIAMPMIRREYILGLLREKSAAAYRKRQFSKLQLQLDPELPVLLAFGRVDRWPPHIGPQDKPLLLHSIQNIAEELLSVKTLFMPVVYDDSQFLWFFQPLALSQKAADPQGSWNQVCAFVQGTAETVQITCSKLLKLPFSLAVGYSPQPWEHAGSAFEALRLLMNFGVGQGEQMLLSAKPQAIDDVEDITVFRGSGNDLQLKRKKLELLEAYLDSRQKQELLELIDEIAKAAEEIGSDQDISYEVIEVFLQLSSFFVSYLNRRDQQGDLRRKIGYDKLTRLEKHESWQEAVHFFKNLASMLCDYIGTAQEQRTDKLIQSIQGFIRDHLRDDLSLTALAGRFYMNPSYLSRIYKQRTGKGMLEFINETKIQKAMELLRQPNLKINDIASMVGLESAPYFTRLFKKLTGITPNEFRERQIKV